MTDDVRNGRCCVVCGGKVVENVKLCIPAGTVMPEPCGPPPALYAYCALCVPVFRRAVECVNGVRIAISAQAYGDGAEFDAFWTKEQRS